MASMTAMPTTIAATSFAASFISTRGCYAERAGGFTAGGHCHAGFPDTVAKCHLAAAGPAPDRGGSVVRGGDDVRSGEAPNQLHARTRRPRMSSTLSPTKGPSGENASRGTTIWEFDEIQTPGAYVFDTTGHLVRVPEDALAPGRSPLLEILAREPMFVTKISDNPYIPITKARLVACDCDLPVNF